MSGWVEWESVVGMIENVGGLFTGMFVSWLAGRQARRSGWMHEHETEQYCYAVTPIRRSASEKVT